jgi:hypothetical protein
MDTMMFAWVLGVPAALLAMVLVLDRLESFVVAPVDRADRISQLIENASPEDVEHTVSVLLAPVVPGTENRSAFPSAEASA